MKYEINKKQEAIGIFRVLWRLFSFVAIIALAYCYGSYKGELYGFERTKEYRQYYEENANNRIENALNDRDAWRIALEACKQDRLKCQ